MSSPSPRANLEVSESLEISASLSLDTLLANLRSAAEKATSEAERSKYGALVTKLEAERSRRSGTAVEGARGAVADLRSMMDPDDHSLAKRAADLATQAGDKIASLTGTTAREVKDVAGKAIDAVKTGDTREIMAAAGDAGVKLGAKTKEVLEQAQSAGMWAMIGNAVKSVAEGVSGLIQSFGEIIKKLFAAIAGFFGFKGLFGGAASEAIGNNVKAGKDVVKKVLAPWEWEKSQRDLDLSTKKEQVWSKLLLLNTRIVHLVDQSKNTEFSLAWDIYVSNLQKTGDNSLGLLLQNWEIDIEAFLRLETGSAKSFIQELKDKGVIKFDIAEAQMQENLWKSIETSGWISKEQLANKRWKFVELMKNPQYKAILDPLRAARNNEKWNPLDAAGNAGAAGLSFLVDLQVAGIIPLEAIVTRIIDGVVQTSFVTARYLATQSVWDFVYTTSGSQLADIAKLPQNEKMVVMASLFSSMSYQLYVTGLVTKITASVWLMWLYWEQGTGLASAKWHIENMLGQYASMAETMEKMASDTLPKHQSQQIAEFHTATRQYIAEKTVQTRLVAAYKANPKITISDFVKTLETTSFIDVANNPKIANEQWLYIKALIQMLSFKQWDSGTNLRTELTKIIQAPVGVTGHDVTISKVGKVWGEVKTVFTGADQKESTLWDLDRSSKAYSEALSRAITEDGPVSSKILSASRVLGYGSPTEFLEAVNKGQIIINAKTPEEAVKIMQNVIKEIPAGLQTLIFKALPFTIAVHDASMSDEKFSTLAKNLAAINPLYASCILFYAGWNLKWHTLEHPGYLISAGTLSALTALELTKIVTASPHKGADLLRFAASPAYVVRDSVGMMTRWARNLYRFWASTGSITEAGKRGLVSAASLATRTHARSAAVTAWIFAAVLVPSLAFSYLEQKRMKDTFTEVDNKWFLDTTTGAIAWGSITKSWSEWTEVQRESLIRIAAQQAFGDEMGACNYDSTKRKVTVVVDAPKQASNSVVGIVPYADLELWKKTMSALGLTPVVEYSKNADVYLSNQFEKRRVAGMSNTAITDLESKISWNNPKQPTA